MPSHTNFGVIAERCRARSSVEKPAYIERIIPNRFDARQDIRPGIWPTGTYLALSASVTIAAGEKRYARLQGCTPLRLSAGREADVCEAPSPTCEAEETREFPMLYYALGFLIVGLVAGALGLVGVAGVASQIA
jgi:hypothetical protein